MTTSMPVHRDERALLHALKLRNHSGLFPLIDVVAAAAVRAQNRDVKGALSHVVDLLEQHVEIDRVLGSPGHRGLVDAAERIRALGLAISRSLEPTSLRLTLVADTLPLEAERCWRLALAVHELVTNAARHACFDGRDGAIKIKLSRLDTVVNCIIADNGSLSTRLKPARGLQMVGDLAKSLGGRIECGFGAQFSSFLVVFPLTERERRANQTAALRRARKTPQRQAVLPISRPQVATRSSRARDLAGTSPAAAAMHRSEMEDAQDPT